MGFGSCWIFPVQSSRSRLLQSRAAQSQQWKGWVCALRAHTQLATKAAHRGGQCWVWHLVCRCICAQICWSCSLHLASETPSVLIHRTLLHPYSQAHTRRHVPTPVVPEEGPLSGSPDHAFLGSWLTDLLPYLLANPTWSLLMSHTQNRRHT